MYPLLFIAPVAVVIIGYMVLRSQGQSSKPPKPSHTDKSWNDVPIFTTDDSNDQSSQVQTQTHRHSAPDQDNNVAPSNCNDVVASDSTSSSNSSWDSGSSSCSVDSSPSVDTNSY